MTTKELINHLLACPMDAEIIFKDKDGKQLHDVTIAYIENQGIGCLFG